MPLLDTPLSLGESAGTQLRSSSRRGPELIAGSVAAVFALFCLDALAFRTGAYPANLEPDSSTGMFELVLWNELERKPDGAKQILVLGDSRARGFLPRCLDDVPEPDADDAPRRSLAWRKLELRNLGGYDAALLSLERLGRRNRGRPFLYPLKAALTFGLRRASATASG